MQKKLSKMIETQEKQTTKRSRMMKNKTNRSIIAAFISAATLMGAGMSLQADTVYWGNTDGNGGDGNWTDAGWYTTNDGDGAFSTATSQPGSADDVISGQTSDASTITVNSDVGTINSLFLTHNNSAPRTVSNLIIDNSGSVNITGTLQTHNCNAGVTSSITVNDGGSLSVGGLATLGIRFESGFNFVQNGGTSQFDGGILLNDSDNTASVYEMKGGSMTAASVTFGRWNTRNKTAEASRLEISGGTVAIQGAVTDAYDTHPAAGHFPGIYRVIGSGAESITLGSMTLDAPNDTSGGGPSRISFLLGPKGVTTTQLENDVALKDAVLQIGLMPGYHGVNLTGVSTFPLLTARRISVDNLTLDQSMLPEGRWNVNWEVVRRENSQILMLTLVSR